MTFDRARIQTTLAGRAQESVYAGTSAWKYERWFNQFERRSGLGWSHENRQAASEWTCRFMATACGLNFWAGVPVQTEFGRGNACPDTPNMRNMLVGRAEKLLAPPGIRCHSVSICSGSVD